MNDNTIEITLSDGTVARWGLDDQTADEVCGFIESIAGQPETVKL